MMRPNGVEKQVRPSGWQPGADTVAYYPLTSSSTVNDMKGSGTAYDLTNHNNVQFGTYDGVDCAYFNGSRALYNTALTNTIIGQTFTILGWCKLASTSYGCVISNNGSSGGYRGWNIDYWNNYSGLAGILRNEFLPNGGSLIPLKSINDMNWHFFCYTHDSSNNSVGYTDTTKAEGTQSITMDDITNFCIGGRKWGGNPDTFFDGYISGIIIENKARTADEISDYYNLTKGDYGIS